MLTAVGIDGVLAPAEGEFRLQVESAVAAEARQHLQQYESENRPPPPPPPPPPLHPHAWAGCAGYVGVLLGVAWAVSSGAVRLDAFELGELDAARVQAGEWWRAWTALTLHLDGPHLAANLAAGTWFGYLAGRQVGSGTAWLLATTGAAAANLIEGLCGPPGHRAVGASTCVFSVLGMMSAYSWRERFAFPQRWARRWGAAGGRRDPARLDRIGRRGKRCRRGRGRASRRICCRCAARHRCRAAAHAATVTARAAMAQRGRRARLARHRLGLRAAQLTRGATDRSPRSRAHAARPARRSRPAGDPSIARRACRDCAPVRPAPRSASRRWPQR